MLLLSSAMARDQITPRRRLIPLPWMCTRKLLSILSRVVTFLCIVHPVDISPVHSQRSIVRGPRKRHRLTATWSRGYTARVLFHRTVD